MRPALPLRLVTPRASFAPVALEIRPDGTVLPRTMRSLDGAYVYDAMGVLVGAHGDGTSLLLTGWYFSGLCAGDRRNGLFENAMLRSPRLLRGAAMMLPPIIARDDIGAEQRAVLVAFAEAVARALEGYARHHGARSPR